jgi:hypothetical protein
MKSTDSSLENNKVSPGKSCLRLLLAAVLSPLLLLAGAWLISLLGIEAPTWLYTVGFFVWLALSAWVVSLINRVIK